MMKVIISAFFLEFMLKGLSSALILPPPNHSWPMSEEEQLAGNLVKRCPFLKSTFRPVVNYSDLIDVTMQFQMIKFGGIDVLNKRMTVSGFAIVEWNLSHCIRWDDDPNWSHIPRIRPIDLVTGSEQQNLPMWHPVIWHANGAENVFSLDLFLSSSFYVTAYIDRDGTAGYEAVGTFVSYCDLSQNLSQFPFDSVTCRLTFQLWMPNTVTRTKNLGFLSQEISPGNWSIIPNNFISDSDVWSLERVYPADGNIVYGSQKYHRCQYYFVFKRRGATYFISIFIPAFALFFLLLADFAMPPEHPERPEYSLCVVLNFFLLQDTVGSKLPNSSEPTVISVYFSCLLWLGTICTAYFCLAAKVARMSWWNRCVMKNTPLGNFTLVQLMDTIAFSIALGLTIIINGTLFYKMMS